jgi:hypothetical protein
MDYFKLMNDVLEMNMSDEGFRFWSAIEKKIPPCWNKFSSSTGKYHKKENGHNPSISQHTHEMLYAAVPLLSMFNIKSKTRESDIILLAIAFHDSFKYGVENKSIFSMYTDSKHDKNTADIILENREVFKKLFTDDEVILLEECVRYHSGRWSTDAKKDFSFSKLNPYTMFIHMLDMLSSRNLIKLLPGENK